jgi:hypothetical protein
MDYSPVFDALKQWEFQFQKTSIRLFKIHSLNYEGPVILFIDADRFSCARSSRSGLIANAHLHTNLTASDIWIWEFVKNK